MMQYQADGRVSSWAPIVPLVRFSSQPPKVKRPCDPMTPAEMVYEGVSMLFVLVVLILGARWFRAK